MTALLVAVGGAAGAVVRYLTDRWVQLGHDTPLPLGTLTVNSVGSAILGFLAALNLLGAGGDGLQALVGVGFCGALTTFSTFGYETLRLLTVDTRFHAIANATVSVLAGFGAAILGVLLAYAVVG